MAETATIFRAVNDRILELSEHWEAGESVHFFCECPDLRCTRPVPLSRDEYARIRSLPEPREIVHPAHVGPSRQVIEANDVYLVVSADGPAANDGPTGG